LVDFACHQFVSYKNEPAPIVLEHFLFIVSIMGESEQSEVVKNVLLNSQTCLASQLYSHTLWPVVFAFLNDQNDTKEMFSLLFSTSSIQMNGMIRFLMANPVLCIQLSKWKHSTSLALTIDKRLPDLLSTMALKMCTDDAIKEEEKAIRVSIKKVTSLLRGKSLD
jgi:hypothetical protein